MPDNERQLIQCSSDFIDEILIFGDEIALDKKGSKITQDDYESEINAIFSSYFKKLTTILTDEQQDESYGLFRQLEFDKRALLSLGFDPGDEAFNSTFLNMIRRTASHASFHAAPW